MKSIKNNEIRKYLIYSNQTLCYEIRCILLTLIILEMFLQLDWTPTVHWSPTVHFRAKTTNLWPECQASRLEETWHHPYGEAWWCSRVFRISDWGGVKVHLPIGQRLKPHSQDNAGVALDKSLNVLEWPSQRTRSNISGET